MRRLPESPHDAGKETLTGGIGGSGRCKSCPVAINVRDRVVSK